VIIAIRIDKVINFFVVINHSDETGKNFLLLLSTLWLEKQSRC
jgi:hypothetical protein